MSRRTALILWTLAVTAGHFALGVGTHREHLAHIALTGLYLVPIVAAAQGWGLRGGLLTASLISGIYLVHMLTTWAGQPMENANQAATMGVFLLIGGLVGWLRDREFRERDRRLAGEARAQREAIVQAFASLDRALRHRDESTRDHCERVARIAVALGQAQALSPERLEALRLAALLHDLGKIGIRDDVLLKADELTEDERRDVARHPAFAADILRPIRGTEAIADLILAHHECPDGSGYPRGLRAEAIPPEAHLLRVADVFAALAEPRPYKPPQAPGEVLDRMTDEAGRKWDAEAFQALRRLHDQGALEPLL